MDNKKIKNIQASLKESEGHSQIINFIEETCKREGYTTKGLTIRVFKFYMKYYDKINMLESINNDKADLILEKIDLLSDKIDNMKVVIKADEVDEINNDNTTNDVNSDFDWNISSEDLTSSGII